MFLKSYVRYVLYLLNLPPPQMLALCVCTAPFCVSSREGRRQDGNEKNGARPFHPGGHRTGKYLHTFSNKEICHGPITEVCAALFIYNSITYHPLYYRDPYIDFPHID